MPPRLASWMTKVDLDVLEFLLNRGNRELVATPRIIAANTGWDSQTVRDHVIVLRDRGLVQYFDERDGIYELADSGRAYLDGELAPEDLEADGE